MDSKELNKEVMEAINTKPKYWRDGQFVFNYIDEKYGIARDIQFKYNIDCFYDDEKINEFIRTAAGLIK